MSVPGHPANCCALGPCDPVDPMELEVLMADNDAVWRYGVLAGP